MNGYFEIVHKNEGTAITVFDKTYDGTDVKKEEIFDFLAKNNIKYDRISIEKAIKKSHGFPVIFTKEKINVIDESFSLNVSVDKLSAAIRFYPPSNGGRYINLNDVLFYLASKNIIYGVDDKAIEYFFRNRIYCTDIVVAFGKRPKEGKDEVVTFSFSTKKNTKPSLNKDGTVDYTNLGLINNCAKDELLCSIEKAVQGTDGMSIYGLEIKAKPVKSGIVKCGANTYMSDDGTKIFASENGHVFIDDGKITVSDVITLKKVDTSTGNIKYDGSVCVEGDVAASFKIEAGGNIVVKGTVEGAVLKSKGDIIIERGINGNGDAFIFAGGDVVTRFIENANISAKGSVNATSILHSNVKSGNEINVEGKRGYIVGGHVIAKNSITANIFGGEMGTTTIIEVGSDPVLKEKIREAMFELNDSNKKLKAILPTVNNITKKLAKGEPIDKIKAMHAQNLMNQKLKYEEIINEKSNLLMSLQDELGASKNAFAMAKNICNGGTTIIIGERSKRVEKPIKCAKFVMVDGQIKNE